MAPMVNEGQPTTTYFMLTLCG